MEIYYVDFPLWLLEKPSMADAPLLTPLVVPHENNNVRLQAYTEGPITIVAAQMIYTIPPWRCCMYIIGYEISEIRFGCLVIPSTCRG